MSDCVFCSEARRHEFEGRDGGGSRVELYCVADA